MKNFFRLLKYARNQRKQAGLNIFFNLIFILSGVFSLTLIMPVLKFLFMPEDVSDIKVTDGFSFQEIYHRFLDWVYNFSGQDKKRILINICIFLLASFAIKNTARYLALVNLKILIHKSLQELKDKVFDKILSLPIRFFNHEKKGDIISRMSNDIKEIEWAMISSLEAIFKEPVSIFVFMGVLVYMSPLLTLYVLLLLPVTAIIISILGKKLKAKSKETQQKQGALLSFLEEVLGGMKIIKSFTSEKQIQNIFGKINKDTANLNISVSKRVDLASPFSETMGVAISCIIIIIGGNMVFQSKIEPEIFIAYFAIFSQLIPPFKQFSNAFYNVQKGMASANRIEEILQTDVQIYESPNPIRIESLNHSITFKKVSFDYGQGVVLDDINLTIQKGQKIALVGQSGSGKTTLTELIPRFYDVTQGSISIDGNNIKDIKLSDLRQLIGIVNQESILFNDSIRNNLLIGNPNATEDQMIEAIRMANATDFVNEKENGLDEIIGERGGKLSGGQKQRISIARALLKNPEILILDEATSALDSESEKFVQNALDELSKGRTTIIIAHRLSTILSADEIIVMEKGKIIERGTHPILMEKDGVYKKLYQMQFYGN